MGELKWRTNAESRTKYSVVQSVVQCSTIIAIKVKIKIFYESFLTNISVKPANNYVKKKSIFQLLHRVFQKT